MSEKVKRTGKFVVVLGVILALVGMYVLIPQAKAAQMSSRNVVISDSRASGTGVSYDFQGTTTATTTRCIKMEFCTTATGSCTTPTGLSTTSATKSSTGWNVFNQANWTLDNSTNGTLKLTYATGENGGSNSSWVINNITNPSSAGTYFVRLNTYSDTGCSTQIDYGVVAFAIVTSGVSVSATVAETLTFSISDYAIGFGELTNAALRYASGDENGSASEVTASTLTLSTNAANGANVTIQDEGNGSSAGLYSAGTSTLIPAVASTDVTAGDDEYGVFARQASGLNIDEGFDNDGTSDVAISRTAQSYVSSTGPVSSGTAGIAAVASILATQQAGSYSDTLIFIATPTY